MSSQHVKANGLATKYALIVEEHTQYFSFLIKYYEQETHGVEKSPQLEYINIGYYEIPQSVEKTEIVLSIYSREYTFRNRKFTGPFVGSAPNDTYYGWSISEKEAQRVEHLILMAPHYDRFLALSKYL